MDSDDESDDDEFGVEENNREDCYIRGGINDAIKPYLEYVIKIFILFFGFLILSLIYF
jgi:hypothetical protein